MPLNTDFTSPLDITLGISVPPLVQQVEAQGFSLDQADLWEDRHRAFNLLRIGGFLTDAESQRILNRLVKGICQAAGYQQALTDVMAQVTQEVTPPEESTPSPELTVEAITTPDALDAYLKNRAA